MGMDPPITPVARGTTVKKDQGRHQVQEIMMEHRDKGCPKVKGPN